MRTAPILPLEPDRSLNSPTACHRVWPQRAPAAPQSHGKRRAIVAQWHRMGAVQRRLQPVRAALRSTKVTP